MRRSDGGGPLADPREPEPALDRLIGMRVSLHKSTGSELTPTLLMRRNFVAGHVPTGEKLEEILAKEIGPGRNEFPRSSRRPPTARR